MLAITVRRGRITDANSVRKIGVRLAPSPGASADAAKKETLFGSAEALAKLTVPPKAVATGVETRSISN